MDKKVVILYSGGLDSTTLLYELLSQGYDVYPLMFNYGQLHEKEINCGLNIVDTIVKLNTLEERGWNACLYTPRVIDMSQVFIDMFIKSALLGNGEIPIGRYTAENQKDTVVPFRNGIMLSLACSFADTNNIGYVALSVHSNDRTVYPDCRPHFLYSMKNAMNRGTHTNVHLIYPFSELYKSAIVKKGDLLGVPFALTWSCYRGLEYHCGICPTCLERKDAFVEAGVEDFTVYHDPNKKGVIQSRPNF